MTFDINGTHLPYYLSEPQKVALTSALKQFPDVFNYSVLGDASEILQGDHWSGFQAINFYTHEKKVLKGLIVSNSCDIDPNNKRALPVNVLFAPMMPLQKFLDMHVKAGFDQIKIDSKVSSIKRQEITDIFYLPKHQNLDEDYVVLFSHIQPMPLDAFIASTERKLEFSLSMIGFYVLLTKLSFHFCRFHEEVQRSS